MSCYAEKLSTQSVFEIKVLGANLDKDNPVFLVKKLVEIYRSRNPHLFKRTSHKVGRPKIYTDEELLGFIFWGNHNEKFTCRKLADWIKNNDESAKYLLNGKRPGKSKISSFKSKNEDMINDFFNFTVEIGKEIGLIDGEYIYQDGTILKAFANKFNNIYPSEIQYIKKFITKWGTDTSKNGTWNKLRKYFHGNEKHEELSEILDEINDNLRSKPLKLLIKSLKSKEKRTEVLKQLKFLESNSQKENSISLSDPECNWMIDKEDKNGLNYNYQIAVDGKHGMIVGQYLTSSTNDYRELKPMVKILKEETIKNDDFTLIADNGYYFIENLEQLTYEGIRIVIPDRLSAKESKSTKEPKKFSKSKFKYIKELDAYICPMGEILLRQNNRSKDGVQYKVYRTSCKNCPCREKCANNKNKEIIDRDNSILDLMKEFYKSEEGNEIYKSRAPLTEGGFGTLKEARNFNGIKRRGLKNANIDLTICAIVHNIKKIYDHLNATFI